MKKLILVLLTTTLLSIHIYAPPILEAKTKMLLQYEVLYKQYKRAIYIENILTTIRKKENSVENYQAIGANGEIGVYQYMKSTYKRLCMRYFGGYREPTPHNQDTIAFCDVQDLVINHNYSIDQIAAYWNSGNPNSRKSGYNKAGVFYDVGAYVNDFRRIFRAISKEYSKAGMISDYDNFNLCMKRGYIAKTDLRYIAIQSNLAIKSVIKKETPVFAKNKDKLIAQTQHKERNSEVNNAEKILNDRPADWIPATITPKTIQIDNPTGSLPLKVSDLHYNKSV
jgi:hypothetical protein